MTPQCHTGGGEACCVWDAELPWNMDVLGLLPDSRPQAISLTLAQQALLLPNCSNILFRPRVPHSTGFWHFVSFS